MTRALVPSLREHGWGRVINVGSRVATTPLPHLVEYSAAKAAVVNMATSLARHLAGSGVTANCVSPGVIVTPTMRRMFQDRAEAAGEDPDWSRLEPEVTVQSVRGPCGPCLAHRFWYLLASFLAITAPRSGVRPA